MLQNILTDSGLCVHKFKISCNAILYWSPSPGLILYKSLFLKISFTQSQKKKKTTTTFVEEI